VQTGIKPLLAIVFLREVPTKGTTVSFMTRNGQSFVRIAGRCQAGWRANQGAFMRVVGDGEGFVFVLSRIRESMSSDIDSSSSINVSQNGSLCNIFFQYGTAEVLMLWSVMTLSITRTFETR
jgi:hypothetical protein